MRTILEREPLVALDYAEVVDESTFVVPTPLAGKLRLLIAGAPAERAAHRQHRCRRWQSGPMSRADQP